MDNPAERYLKAADRPGTVRRYRLALDHFEQKWGGLLPTSSESVVRYLGTYAEDLSSSTLQTHLAALASWHQSRGFLDPTKHPDVRKVLRGIRAEHPRPVKQAEALPLRELELCVQGLQKQMLGESKAERLRACRDRALILLGFWRAFRADDLCRLRIEHIKVRTDKELEFFAATAKADRENRGRVFTVPALKRLCPVHAYEEWLALSGLSSGPVFRSIDRWGNVSGAGLCTNGISRLLRVTFIRLGLEAESYTGHSLRRGFATWANGSKWGTKDLMDYVGWRDVQSAMRYIDSSGLFNEWLKDSRDP